MKCGGPGAVFGCFHGGLMFKDGAVESRIVSDPGRSPDRDKEIPFFSRDNAYADSLLLGFGDADRGLARQSRFPGRTSGGSIPDEFHAADRAIAGFIRM